MGKWEEVESKYNSVKEYVYRDEDDGQVWMSASVKWDGCLELRRFFNVPYPQKDEHPQMVDRIHICSLESFVDTVVSLERISHNWRDEK